MATLRELKGRIGSVASSEKITGAMKMISSAKMHKAEGILRRLSPFRDCVSTIITSLLHSDADVSSPLTEDHAEVKRVAIVVLGSDDGLCGAYNVNIFKALLDNLAAIRSTYGEDVYFDIIPVGKKMANAVNRISSDSHVTVTLPEGIDSKSDGDAVKAFAQSLQERFLAGDIDKVQIEYMSFISAGKQHAVAEDFLPIHPAAGDADGSDKPYIFEPDAATLFRTVIPMFLLSQMQEAFAQNRASEQAARVMAMQSANDNAQKLLEQLQLEYNKLRQQGITTELLDIVGGQRRD
ncbi:MAG: ATP synthase F1 subunit gamma [Muribaculaceae bacterium]|nr:ATP synthase F1 subunit gamma [Muribaculaceae bacterium]